MFGSNLWEKVMIGIIRNKSLFACCSLVAFQPAFAQSEAGEKGLSTEAIAGSSKGEIVVTAQRVETLLSETPLAITALSEEDLRDKGVQSAVDLNQLAPGLSVNRFGQGLQVTIRGVTSQDLTEKGDPSAAFLLDGVYIARPQGIGGTFFDIERVEILRGPQGTLYGRNATAGVINVISKKPTDYMEMTLNGSVGNLNSYDMNFAISGPVSPTLSARFAGSYSQQDSYIIQDPNSPFDIPPARQDYSWRAQLLWKPSDNFDVLIRGDYAYLAGSNFAVVSEDNFFDYSSSVPPVPSTPTELHLSSEQQRQSNAIIPIELGNNNRSWGVALEANWDVGPVTFTYLGSHRELERNENFLTELLTVYAANLSNANVTEESHELRFATNTKEPFFLQAGAYYFEEKGDLENYVYDTPISAPPGSFISAQNLVGGGIYPVFGSAFDRVYARNYSFFGQGTYEFITDLSLTVGARYSNDRKDRRGGFVQQLDLQFDPATDLFSPTLADTKNDEITWRVGLDWDVTGNTLIYGAVATGYKAGGFNDGCLAGTSVNGIPCVVPLPAELLTYEPEEITSYELGVKTALFNKNVRLNLAAFHYDYENLQLLSSFPTVPGQAGVALYVNARAATVEGVELEGSAHIFSNTDVDFTLSYLDAKYDEYFPRVDLGAAGPDFAGLPLDRSPEWTASAYVSQTFPLSGGTAFRVTAGTRWSDDYYLSNYILGYQVKQSSYFKSDVTVTYANPLDRWYIQAFVKNIEDNVEANFYRSGFGYLSLDPNAPPALLTGYVGIGAPRTFGVRASIGF